MKETYMFKLYFYVPEENCEEVKEAVFEAGAGKIGNYTKCSWQTAGTGQFLPGQDSQPTIGRQGQIERLKEFRVEMVVDQFRAEKVVDALINAHPYEEPAYGLIRIFTKKDFEKAQKNLRI